MRLLLVEDDHGLADGIAFSMEREGYEVLCAGSVAAARKFLQNKTHIDVILLDLNLPDGDGIDFCREIRSSRGLSRIPILMLTARDMETDEVQGLLSGADDYLTKPFSLAVLKARLDTVLRRCQGREVQEPGKAVCADTADGKGKDAPGSGYMLESGEIRLLPGKMKVFRSGQEIECSATEFRLLYYLMENRGQVLLKEQILEHVWDSAGGFVDENTLQVAIGRLRRKLEKYPSNPQYIRTIHGMGYIFAKEV